MSGVVQREFELEDTSVIVDPRSFWKRQWDSLQAPWIPLAWAVIAALITVAWSGFFVFGFIVFLVLRLAVTIKPDVLPIHLPIEANKEDRNDPRPADSGYYKARGSFYIGRIRKSGLEVWVSFKALTQHFLIFGTTGAGKTESIVSYICNYLAAGSGVAFQDAKAAPKAMIQMATFCRIFGRDGDFRVTNYITGQTSTIQDPASRSSNDAAVFARGNADSNTQLLVGLMPPSNGENKIFAERAVALVSAVMPALTDLRDLGKLQIDPGTIRSYMSFNKFSETYRNPDIRMRSRNAMLEFLKSLPGYTEGTSIQDLPEEVTRQFGFGQAYFTRSLASLSDTYGHIYMVGQGEIDYQDAVLNGRILMTLLPSLEKAGEELSNLGKIVLTATRNGMVVGLGTVFEGSADDIVHNLPTNCEVPYGIMNDENAYMLMEGQEMINAQARGLGFGALTGTQDISGMMENISRTTKQILANSAFKQFGYLDDEETTKLACELAGEATVMVKAGYERDGDMGNVYARKDVSIEKRTRITPTAIKKQGLGQFIITYQGKVHQVQVFNHGIQEKDKDPNKCYLNHWFPVRMAKVKLPTQEELFDLIKLHPNPAWQEMAVLLADDSRATLQEMRTYFGSMLLINKMARTYADNTAMLDLNEQVYGAADRMLDIKHEPSTGLIAQIESTLVAGDINNLFSSVIKNSKTQRVSVQREADLAGLDSVLEGLSDEDLAQETADTSTDSGTTGGGSTGGFGNKPAAHSDDVLSAYLQSDEPETKERAASDQPQASQEPHKAPIKPLEINSDVAKAVERNLANMPWMASAVSYTTTRTALLQTELYFTDDANKAATAVDNCMDALADQLNYPETQIQPADFSPETVKAFFNSIYKK